MPSTTDAAQRATDARDPSIADAARLRLLRRLAPSLRHEAVAHLQPLAMLGSLLDRRLAAPSPDLGKVREGTTRLVESSRAAVQSCLDLVAWLAPDPTQAAPLREVVAETVALMRGSLGFRGFSLDDSAVTAQALVARGGLRMVLASGLLWLTDSAGPPGELRLEAADAEADGPRLRLTLELEPTDGPSPADAGANGPALTREDVVALAASEGAQIAIDGDRLTLDVPRVDRG